MCRCLWVGGRVGVVIFCYSLFTSVLVIVVWVVEAVSSVCGSVCLYYGGSHPTSSHMSVCVRVCVCVCVWIYNLSRVVVLSSFYLVYRDALDCGGPICNM